MTRRARKFSAGAVPARRRGWRWLAAAVACLLAACAPTPAPLPEEAPPAPVVGLERVAEHEWPALSDDMDPASFYEACSLSIAYLKKLTPDQAFEFGPDRYSAAELVYGLMRLRDVLARQPDPGARAQALKREFHLYRAVGRDGRGGVLFTGYYEPVLEGSRLPNRRFNQPLYAVPADLVTMDLRQWGEDLPARRLVGRVGESKVTPYPDREAIDFGGAIQGKAKALAWIEDPVEAFFLHIQGSGQVVFSDGSRLRLGYAGQNGRPYRGIARLLMDEGLMTSDEMSMQNIKRLLAARPEIRRRVLSYNPSYVFFRPLSPEGGPLGCYETPLVAGRSIATDRKVFPGLAAGFIAGERPVAGGKSVSFARFVVNQDTGGAIKGPGRLDLYFGSGEQAGNLAGRMKHQGRLYFFAPKR